MSSVGPARLYMRMPFFLVALLLVLPAVEPAIAQINQTVSTRPDSAFERARMAAHSGWFELADDLLKSTIEENPGHRLAWAYLAMVDVFLFRDPAQSLKNLQESIDTGDGKARTTDTFVEAVVQFASADLEASATLTLDYLSSDPTDPYARDLLGMTYADLGMEVEAVEELRELLREFPAFLPGWYHLGNVFLDAGDLAKARVAHSRFLSESMNENPAAFDAMAEILARSGETRQAVKLLNRALEIEPRMAYAWLHMGDILADSGDTEEAEQAYQNAIDAAILYGDEFRTVAQSRINELD